MSASPPYLDSPWNQVLQQLRAATAGEFVIQRELGRGGFAAVFLAHEIVLGRKVAIKVMSPAVMMGEGMVDRFLQEARTVAGLNHPHIITIHSVRRLDELPYFIMKFVRGRSLEHVLRREGRLPIPVIRDLLFQVGSALAYAHRRGVIHRDVKPANILLGDDGNAVVTDFGIAKVAEATSYTLTGMVIGTLTYMSPEQCEAQTVTWASDQYSLGIVAYEMLTGSVPFTGSSFAVMHAHAETPPAPIRSKRPDCPPDLAAAVDRMLAKAPAERWPTMADALAALGAAAVPDTDPLREELAQLARVDLRDDDECESTVPSPVPQLRTPAFTNAGGFSLAVSPAPESLAVGRQVRLSAVVRDADSREVHRKVEWRSTDPSVALVSPDGVVTGVGHGEAAISATAEGAEGSVRLVVVGPERVSAATAVAQAQSHKPWKWVVAVGTLGAIAAGAALALGRRDGSDAVNGNVQVAAALELSTTRSAVAVGDSAMLVATVKNGRGLPILGQPAAWTTSDPAVVSVDSTGMIVARSPGTAVVTATRDGASAQASITVTAKPETVIAAAAPPRDTTRAAVAPEPTASPPLKPAPANQAVVAITPHDTTRAAEVKPLEPPDARIHALAAGGSLTCGTRTGGQAVCWGGGEPRPRLVAGFAFTQITAGDGHACGLTSAGEAYCWGANSQGQLGDGSTRNQPTPVAVKLGQRFSSLSAGASHTCGIAAGNVAYCWGANGSGQLGDGTETARLEPTPVQGHLELKQIAAGGFHTCALTTQGEVACWGDGASGQLGNKSQDKSVEPVVLAGTFKAITAGHRHTCGLTEAGKAFCWGENSKGQLGDASTDDRSWPQPVVLIEPFRSIDAGAAHTCGILAKGGLFCWGDNSSGQLGDGTRTTRPRPTAVTGGQRFTMVQAGAVHTCGAGDGGEPLFCWGSSSRGQAGAPGGIQTAPAEIDLSP